jgi:hypothetical protein
MEGYHGAALLSELDVQARGGGGAAERLHASCRHLVAAAEIEGPYALPSRSAKEEETCMVSVRPST